MSEPKQDPLSASGRHRLRLSLGGLGFVRAGQNKPENQRHWLNKPQSQNSRHGAITGSLYNWPSYKSWAEKVKSAWDKDKKGK